MNQVKIPNIARLLIANRNAIVLTVIYFLALAIVLDGLFHNIISGGNAWKQGDWLINNHESAVRRGMLGSSLLLISSTFDFSVLYLLAVIQGAAVSIIFVFFWYAGVHHRNNDVLTFLLLSPVFLVFWANDLQGGLRKELLAYLAFLPLLFAFVQYGFVQFKHVLLSLVIWTMAVFAHEANVFFAPFLAAATYMGLGSRGAGRYVASFAVAYFAIAGAGVVYALHYSSVENSMVVCAALLDAGLKEGICGGAIQWLEYDVWYGMEQALSIVFSWRMYYFVLTLVFITMFIIFLFREFFPARVVGYFLLVNVSFLPLYVMAVDWGRWLNFGMFSFISMYIVIASQKGRLHDFPRMSYFSWFCSFLFCVVWGVRHVGGVATLDLGFAKVVLGLVARVGAKVLGM